MSVVILPEPPPFFFSFFFFTLVSNQSPPLTHARRQGGTTGRRQAAVNRPSSGGEMETSCQVLCLLSRKLSLPVSCFFLGFFLFVVFFFFTCLYSPTSNSQQTELIAAAERPGRDVASQPHVHIVQFLFNETRRWALLQSRSHLLIPPPTSSTPHSHTHLHLPFLSSALIWSAAICSFICSSPGWPGYFYWISYYWSEGHGRLSFLVEIKTCSRCRTAWWKSTGIKYDTTIMRFR